MSYSKLLPFDTKLARPQLAGKSNDRTSTQGQNLPADAKSLLSDTKNTAAAHLSFNSAFVTRILGAIALILVLASSAAVLTNYLTGYSSILVHKTVKLFYVDLELNVPAFFSMLLLLFAAGLLVFITVIKRKQMAPHVFYWGTLALGFLFMAFDEIVAVHERLIEPMRTLIGDRNLGILYFAWVVPAMMLVLFLAFFFLRFLWRLPAKTSLSFVFAAILYLGAAIGLEFIEGSHAEVYGKENLTYIMLTTTEEALEMLGAIVFIRALLDYVGENYKEVLLRFDYSER